MFVGPPYFVRRPVGDSSSSLTLAWAEDMRIAKCVRWLQEHEVWVEFTRVRVQPSKLHCPIMLWEYSQNAHLVSSWVGSISFMKEAKLVQCILKW